MSHLLPQLPYPVGKTAQTPEDECTVPDLNKLVVKEREREHVKTIPSALTAFDASFAQERSGRNQGGIITTITMVGCYVTVIHRGTKGARQLQNLPLKQRTYVRHLLVQFGESQSGAD